MLTETRSLVAAANVARRNSRPVITGYAAVFNTLSNEMRTPSGKVYREIIRPGAFAESLRSGVDVVARLEHVEILGRTSNGTLRLWEDARGLRYSLDPPDTAAGRDLVELLRRGDMKSSSFTFVVRPHGDTWRSDGRTTTRELLSVRLIDVAPVGIAAYDATSANVWLPDPLGTARQRLRLTERAV